MFSFSMGRIQAGIRKCPNSKVSIINDVAELRDVSQKTNKN